MNTIISMKQKQFYEAPEAQTFVVQAEGFICTSGDEELGVEIPGMALDLDYGSVIDL